MATSNLRYQHEKPKCWIIPRAMLMTNNCLRYGVELISDAGLLPERFKGRDGFCNCWQDRAPWVSMMNRSKKEYVELQEYNTDTKK